MIYELYYWPGIQGRGEFVRLALEDAAASYVDFALVPDKEGGGVAALERFLDGRDVSRPPFAPPFLRAGQRLIAQTANILLFLGERLNLAPRDPTGKLWVHQLQLTIADFIVEIHDTHHPIAGGLYYRQQKPEALRRSKDFIANRLPKFFGYFERVLQRNPHGPGMVGRRITYVDLSMAQSSRACATRFRSRRGARFERARDSARCTTTRSRDRASRATSPLIGDCRSTTTTSSATIPSWTAEDPAGIVSERSRRRATRADRFLPR